MRPRSPIWWGGGKSESAAHIVTAFPPPNAYDVYCEPFGGAASVLYAKDAWGHRELYRDLDPGLVTFWHVARDEGQRLAEKVDELPYARRLYYQAFARLAQREITDVFERAQFWFYVNRSSFGGKLKLHDSPSGWGYVKLGEGSRPASLFRNAIRQLARVPERMARVEIARRDFEEAIAEIEGPRTLLYCDPPYIGTEGYYGPDAFTAADHERLARRLNATQALVALSYYEHPDLERLYPPERWRRMRWGAYKKVAGASRVTSTEVLLMNYPETRGGLWG